MDRFLRKNTHFWKIFMTRGQNKCIVGFVNKGENKETTYIAPDDLDKSFLDNGVSNLCQITLYDITRINLNENDEDEGGEFEMEENEFDGDENMEEGAEGKAAEGEEQPPAKEDEGVAQVVEESEDADNKKKASDVLFND